jgi:peptide deformylase
MKSALHQEEDGVAIAAPQIGESLRIFVESGRVKQLIDGEYDETNIPADKVYINPEIIRLSRKKTKVEEGCLSVRWLYGFVERSEKARICAYDEFGKKFEKGASGLEAQIFQHEVDHLNGILFIDKAENIENLPPAKKR